LIEVSTCPGIQQSIAGASVETGNWGVAICGQYGDVCYATYIEDNPGFSSMTEHGCVKSTNQGCALAAGSHVAASEIGHGGYSCLFGNTIGIADLHGERGCCFRSVADGLAMTADGSDLLWGMIGFL
jgi:hypothetical protein